MKTNTRFTEISFLIKNNLNISNKAIEVNIFTSIFNINYIKCYFFIYILWMYYITNENTAPNSDLINFIRILEE